MRFYLLLAIVGVSMLGPAQADQDPVQFILQRHAASFGGERGLAALSSLRIEGTQLQDGQSLRFTMRKKRGGLHYHLSAGESTITCGFDGRSGWQRLASGGEVQIEALSPAQLAVLREESNFSSPLLRGLDHRRLTLSLLESQNLAGNSFDVLQLSAPGRSAERYYLDADSGLLLKREQLNADGTLQLETLYRDYREVDGYPFAFEVESRLGDEQLALIRIDSIEVNPGLLSFYFDKPRS